MFEDDGSSASQTNLPHDPSYLRAQTTKVRLVSSHLTLQPPRALTASRQQNRIASSWHRKSEDADAQSRTDGRVHAIPRVQRPGLGYLQGPLLTIKSHWARPLSTFHRPVFLSCCTTLFIAFVCKAGLALSHFADLDTFSLSTPQRPLSNPYYTKDNPSTPALSCLFPL